MASKRGAGCRGLSHDPEGEGTACPASQPGCPATRHVRQTGGHRLGALLLLRVAPPSRAGPREWVSTRTPRVVAELGPGDSLGIGLAALLTGADHYVGLDIFAYADSSRNLAVLDELVEMFGARASIPDSNELPDVKPYLPSYEFPGRILSAERLASLTRSRARRCDPPRPAAPRRRNRRDIDRVSRPLVRRGGRATELNRHGLFASGARARRRPRRRVRDDAQVARADGPDVPPDRLPVPSQGRHLERPLDVFGPGLEGRGRPPRLPAEPRTVFPPRRDAGESGFEVVIDRPVRAASVLKGRQLASRFRALSDDDLTTSGAYLVAAPAAEVAVECRR